MIINKLDPLFSLSQSLAGFPLKQQEKTLEGTKKNHSKSQTMQGKGLKAFFCQTSQVCR